MSEGHCVFVVQTVPHTGAGVGVLFGGGVGVTSGSHKVQISVDPELCAIILKTTVANTPVPLYPELLVPVNRIFPVP